MNSIDALVSEAHSFIREEFGIDIEKSKLKMLSPSKWVHFCEANGFDAGCNGLYVPSSYSSYVNEKSQDLTSDILHEFFGHGLFCEKSKLGKSLVEISGDRNKTNKFLFGAITQTGQQIGLCSKNIFNYEGFAMWCEALLCDETGNSMEWQQKIGRLPDFYKNLFGFFRDAEQKMSRYGLLWQMGFPRIYDNNKLIEAIRCFYGPYFPNIDMIILYGSRKPESDIDLFIVSNNRSINYFNGWLDIYELNRYEFQGLADNLDISVTDPIFSGELIYGDSSYLTRIKCEMELKEISPSMISHNQIRAYEQECLSVLAPERSREQISCKRYAKTYEMNSRQLLAGNKYMTKHLLEYHEI